AVRLQAGGAPGPPLTSGTMLTLPRRNQVPPAGDPTTLLLTPRSSTGYLLGEAANRKERHPAGGRLDLPARQGAVLSRLPSAVTRGVLPVVSHFRICPNYGPHRPGIRKYHS